MKEDFGRRIKGQTLTQIYEKYFSDLPEAQQEIYGRTQIFMRKSMSYEYIPRCRSFLLPIFVNTEQK